VGTFVTILLIAVLGLIQLYLLANAVYLYYPMVGAIGARVRPKDDSKAPAVPPSRMAVLVAAHNEELVIGPTVSALLAQRYPKNAFEVFVVADNCQDETATVARRAGATVYERFTDAPSTKGQALHFLWKQLPRGRYGAVVIVDADNQADPTFLSAIASELAHGFPVVQGIRRAKNDEDGGTAGLDALTELCTHRVGAAGRRWLGLNGPIMGSGVAYHATLFDRLIKEVGTTVVEDCEWQAKLALENVAIIWTDRAVIYDEKTAKPAAMQTQRNRWMAGRGQVARAYVKPLLKSFFATGNWNALDMAAFLLTPPRVLTLAGFGGMWLLSLAHVPGAWPAALWFVCLALFAAYVCLGLYLDGAPARAYMALFKGALLLPRFALQMAGATWKALTGARVRWVATPHGR
jgi:cellulose synthase/poly-beta-1,6-N-acetylglucosamine synthase-like glycosyltransferase